MKKILFYVLENPDETMKIYHLFLNIKDLRSNGFEVKTILEGDATKIPMKMADSTHPLNTLYKEAKPSITAVCKGCAIATGGLEAAEKEGLPIIGDLENHVSTVRYLNDGYELIVVG
jgi:hypothetical protein